MTSHAPEETPADDLAGEALRLELAEVISTLDQLAASVAALVDSRQRGLGFLSHEGRLMQDEAVRAERQALGELREKAKTEGWTLPDIAGATAAPGNLAGITVDVELWATTRHQLRRIVQAAENNGDVTGLLDQLPDRADTRRILAALRTAIWDSWVDDTLLQAALRDLRTARDTARRLVDGDDRVRLAAPCPYCGRHTLVVTFNDGAITCGKDPDTGRNEGCTCPDPLCECKARPYSYRHTWWRHRANKPGGWHNLRGLLDRGRLTQKGPRP